MTKEHEELKRLAEAATPGKWEVADLNHGLVVRTESASKSRYGASRYAAVGGFDRSNPDQHAEALANAKWIAAAHPQAILDLIRQLEEAQEENERLRGALLCFYDAWSADRRSVQVTAIETAKSALAKEPK